jgi:hypothetical protein
MKKKNKVHIRAVEITKLVLRDGSTVEVKGDTRCSAFVLGVLRGWVRETDGSKMAWLSFLDFPVEAHGFLEGKEVGGVRVSDVMAWSVWGEA